MSLSTLNTPLPLGWSEICFTEMTGESHSLVYESWQLAVKYSDFLKCESRHFNSGVNSITIFSILLCKAVQYTRADLQTAALQYTVYSLRAVSCQCYKVMNFNSVENTKHLCFLYSLCLSYKHIRISIHTYNARVPTRTRVIKGSTSLGCEASSCWPFFFLNKIYDKCIPFLKRKTMQCVLTGVWKLLSTWLEKLMCASTALLEASFPMSY